MLHRHPRFPCFLLLMGIVGLALAPCRLGRAQPAPEPDLHQRFAAAVRLYETQSFARAEAEFRALWEDMVGHPRRAMVLVNIGRCVEAQGGRDSEALRLYEQMLDETASATDPSILEARELAQERTEELRARGAARATNGDADGASGAESPAQPAPSSGASPAGPIVAGAGAALIVAAAITGAVALAQRGSVTARCEGTRCPPESEGAAAEVASLALASDVLWISGGVAALVGLVLAFVLRDGSAAEPNVAAGCNESGCVAELSSRF